jgi:hypothetical protein
MKVRSARFLVLATAIGFVASIVVHLSSNQAKAASVNIATGVGGASYTLGYVMATSASPVPTFPPVLTLGPIPTVTVTSLPVN